MTGAKDLSGRLSELRTYLQLANAERLAASWAIQPREERKRRLHAVLRLSVELARIQETTAFSTRLAENAIEAVIEGDWKMVEEWSEHFTFDSEEEQLRARFAPVFAVFRELLLQTLRANKGMRA
jgi:L-rhamnose isomerase